MPVQYKAKAITKKGGGGSSKANKDDKGPIKTTLIGNKMEAKMLFHAIDDPIPG